VSHDLFVFKGPIPASEEEFVERFERFYEGDESVFEASPTWRRSTRSF
jgi:hypothetical protein